MASNLKKWNISDDPIAYYVAKRGNANASTLPLYIPVLMPLITKSTMCDSSKTINRSCFVNATQCMPSIASNIKTRNYMEVKRSNKESFSNPYLHYGDKIQLDVGRSDENRLSVTNDLDPSSIIY